MVSRIQLELRFGSPETFWAKLGCDGSRRGETQSKCKDLVLIGQLIPSADEVGRRVELGALFDATDGHIEDQTLLGEHKMLSVVDDLVGGVPLVLVAFTG